jgi:selenocysteine lyase/cysteine desulfurase
VLDRRRFLSLGSGVAAALSLPRSLVAELEAVPPGMPDAALHATAPDRYWAELRRKFLIPPGEIYLNNGTCGSSPAPVLQAVFDGYNTLEQMADADPEDYPIWGYGPWNQFRDPLAAFVGCTRNEIALVRNSTEGNSYIANGIDMKPGDEVLMTDQEHPGGEQAWQLKAKRYGIVVKKVTLPKPVVDADQVLNLFNDAITDRTRVLFFSHITTVTGVVLPAKALAALARSKGILSVVDGAHVTGMMRLNVADIGCDAYSSSPHKWLQAPKGTGYLYIRDDVIDRIWNTIVTEGWEEPALRAERFQRIGSSNVPTLWGLNAAITFATQIGIDRIEQRHRALGDYMLAEMQKRGAESWTSPDPALRCAIITVNVPPVVRKDLETWLWQQHKVRIRGGEPSKLRLSTPYYLQEAEIDRFLALFDQYKRDMPAHTATRPS